MLFFHRIEKKWQMQFIVIACKCNGESGINTCLFLI